ncbi:PREDICTED: coiled-coil domain-containing protein 157, partial [Nestor notabilis]|uniref:coiled-coil domain-containing protein 157 n=1 Tax=Nestor notabilis TaxID=176057 RepID=UPI0005232C0A
GPPARAVAPGMSAGLTVRRYWCCMLKLGAFYQQLLAEKAASRQENPTLPSSPQAGTPEKEPPKRHLPDVLELKSSRDIAPSTSLCLPSGALTPASGDPGSSAPRAAHSAPGQPTETSPGPCATCTSIQGSLYEVGKAITSICQSQNIPSALSRFQGVLRNTAGSRTLSATDVSYWASEQSKDLARISKHLQVLLQRVQPLRAELQESGKQKEKLQRQVEDLSRLLQVERDTHMQQRKEAQESLEAKNKMHLEAVLRLERAKDDLQRGAALLEEQVSTLKEELAGKQAAMQELETAKATLLQEMRTTMVARSRVLELEEKVQLLTNQQESLRQELSTTTTQLDKEKAKVESMERHQEEVLIPAPGWQIKLGQGMDRACFARMGTGSWTEDMRRQLQANSIRIRRLEQENARLGAALDRVKAAAQEGVLKLIPQSQLWPQLSQCSGDTARQDKG